MVYCKICDSWDCGIEEHHFHIGKTLNKKEFSGSSPPEIFVGKWNYPNVYAGILSPEEYGDTKIMSSPEEWHKNQLPIQSILQQRNKLIYARTTTNIKSLQEKFTTILQEVAMTHKSISAEFKLKRPIFPNREQDPKVPLISNAAELSQARLQENPSIKPKVEYLVNDIHVKSQDAIKELNKSGIETTTISKILSAGLLGIKKNRKLVPTKWSITAVDDILSKSKLEKIRFFPELNEILLFSAYYLGNHYEFLLLPGSYSFEVIELSMSSQGVWQDYESILPRKKYADSVTGAYYVNRLALTEYLEKIKRQCRCIVFREVRPEYNVPLGVGILRQVSREAFSKNPEKPSSLNEALLSIQKRIKSPISIFTKKSVILNQKESQQSITRFF